MSLAHLRRWLQHRRSARALGLVIALAVLCAAGPRLEVHSHAESGHAHVSAADHTHHHAEAERVAADLDPSFTPHLHQAASTSVAVLGVDPLQFHQLSPESWPDPSHDSQPPPSPRSALLRPPIS